MTEINVNIITEESIENSSYFQRNDVEYGKFTTISPEGDLVVIGSNLNTMANTVPYRNNNNDRFKLYIEKSFSFESIFDELMY